MTCPPNFCRGWGWDHVTAGQAASADWLTVSALVDSSLLLEAGLTSGDLSEAEWRILKGLLPIEAANLRRGRRPEQNWSIINGILWQLRFVTRWRDVPPKYGNWNTIYRCFRR